MVLSCWVRGSVLVDGDLTDAGVDLEVDGRGAGTGRSDDGAGQVLVEAAALGAVDVDVAGEVHLGVDVRVDALGQQHLDLAGVEVQVHLPTVEGGEVADAAQVEHEVPVGDGV